MRRRLRRCIRSRRLRKARGRDAPTRGRRAATARTRRVRRVRQRLIRLFLLRRGLGLRLLLRPVRRLRARHRSFRFLARRIRRRCRVGRLMLRNRVRQRQRARTRLLRVGSLRMRAGFMMRVARGVPVRAAPVRVPAPVRVTRVGMITARRIRIRPMMLRRRSGDARSCRRWRGRVRMSARPKTSRWRSTT